MIYGIDISHWNKREAVTGLIEGGEIRKPEFVIIKLSEGKTGYDKECINNIRWALQYTDLIGLYHYVRPENNSYLDEAANIYKRYKDIYAEVRDKHCLLVLDIEGKALNPAYKNFMYNIARELTEEFGKPPVIYMQASSVNTYYTGTLSGLDCGLWVAHYDYKPEIDGTRERYHIPFTAFKQYASRPIDLNVFYGNREQYIKYCL